MNKLYPTMITPFKKNYTIDFDGVSAILEWYKKEGCDGVFSVCQSSEMFFLSQEERIELAKYVVDHTDLDVIASGHIGNSITEEIQEMSAMAKTGVSAIIFVSNRFAFAYESDDIWIENFKRVRDNIPEDVKLGIYECPYPYKRILTTKIIEFLLKDDKFSFIKDTCCDLKMIAERSKICKDSHIKLYNANAGSLLYSLQHGYSGYSGVMANFHPKIYAELLNCDYYSTKATKIQNFIAITAYLEQQNYPLNAKFYQSLIGLPIKVINRNIHTPMTDLQKLEMKYLHALTKDFLVNKNIL